MATKLGLKLWSTNTNWFPQAIQLIDGGLFQVIELYIVPGADLSTLEPLKGLPIRIHAPHENHQFNAFALTDAQVRAFQDEVSAAATMLQASTIVVHAGVGEDQHLFAQQIERLADPRIIIENMPLVSLDGTTCFGYSMEQLAFIHQTMSRELCLDIGHAIKSAVSQKIDYKEFLSDILATFQPTYFHLSDGDSRHEADEHLALGSGDYDLPWIKRQLQQVAQQHDIQVILEVPKNNLDLGNDVINAEYWNALP